VASDALVASARGGSGGARQQQRAQRNSEHTSCFGAVSFPIVLRLIWKIDRATKRSRQGTTKSANHDGRAPPRQFFERACNLDVP
jgi:hypothetical protein